MWTPARLTVYDERFEHVADAQSYEVGGTIQPPPKCGKHSNIGNHFTRVIMVRLYYLTTRNQE
jgi:hypothetical protein